MQWFYAWGLSNYPITDVIIVRTTYLYFALIILCCRTLLHLTAFVKMIKEMIYCVNSFDSPLNVLRKHPLQLDTGHFSKVTLNVECTLSGGLKYLHCLERSWTSCSSLQSLNFHERKLNYILFSNARFLSRWLVEKYSAFFSFSVLPEIRSNQAYIHSLTHLISQSVSHFSLIHSSIQ